MQPARLTALPLVLVLATALVAPAHAESAPRPTPCARTMHERSALERLRELEHLTAVLGRAAQATVRAALVSLSDSLAELESADLP